MKRVLPIVLASFGAIAVASQAQASPVGPIEALKTEDYSVGMSILVPSTSDEGQEAAAAINGKFTVGRLNDSLSVSVNPFFTTETEFGGTVDLNYEATENLTFNAGVGGVVLLDETQAGTLTAGDDNSSLVLAGGASYDFSDTTGVYAGVLVPTGTETEVVGRFGLNLRF